MFLRKFIFAVIILSVICFTAVAQLLPVQHPRNQQKRTEVDAKRVGTDINSADALPRSREFIRTDSTYYVGWMYEGMYKANRAADFLGYKNAAAPLQKALNALERDYARYLRTRSSDLMTYYPVYRFHLDYTMIAYSLMECYSNIEQPQQAFNVVRNALKWNFQFEGHLQSYNYLAWIVHRNRFYTQSQYPFLKNSINLNEQAANRYLDSGLRKINIDKRLNENFFPNYVSSARQSVYHYKAMLYSYALNVDSATKYYGLMKSSPYFSQNNYGTFLAITGNFRAAEKAYESAALQDAGDKRLQEWAYYSSILDIYKNDQPHAIAQLKDMIKAVGSTPGFGWYNIALARSCAYNGKTIETQKYLNKAEGFKELHIGTTLGQSHYDFSINLIKLMNNIQQIQQIKFEHSGWWYSPSKLAELAKQNSAKYLLQYLMVNQFAMNPERDLVVYRLFSTESTVTWDEIWYLMRDFSTNFFLERFEQEIKDDKRPLVKKYFKLYLARLQMKKGQYAAAQKTLYSILNAEQTDLEYEKLFVARTYETLAECAKARKNKKEYHESMYSFYVNYPQLVPYSDMKANMRLHFSGTADKELLQSLKDCNINWVSDNSTMAPIVSIVFGGSTSKRTVTFQVQDRAGNKLVKPVTYSYTKPSEAFPVLAYGIFGIDKR